MSTRRGRIFLDANILFSAARKDGAIRRLLRKLREAGYVCVADPYVITEAKRNLKAKFPQAMETLEDLLRDFECIRYSHRFKAGESSSLLPEKDQPVLEAARLTGCGYLVTGDRTHFGRLYGRKVEGVKIHSPRSLAEALGIR